MIMLRYLNFVPGAEKIFTDHEELLKIGITDVQMATVFKAIQKKMMKLTGGNKTPTTTAVVKQERLDEDSHIFLAEEEAPPPWAKGLCDQVKTLKEEMENFKADVHVNYDGETSEVMYNNYKNNKPFSQKRRSQFPCWICNRTGHLANSCFERICGKCGIKGHHEKNCNNHEHQNKPNFSNPR